MMTVVHANDPTTQVLSLLYESRRDVACRITEASGNGAVARGLREADCVMMLGHGNPYGLFSTPEKDGRYRRFLVTDRHVQFLRNKTCIGIWCYANEFALRYGLEGLFSGMIISELQEATDLDIPTTREEIDREMEKFTQRLRWCIETTELKEVPERMKELDDIHSPLTTFNYNNLFYCSP